MTFSYATAQKSSLSPSEIIEFHTCADHSPRMRVLLIGAFETRLVEIEKEIETNRNEPNKLKRIQKHADLRLEGACNSSRLKILKAVSQPNHWTSNR